MATNTWGRSRQSIADLEQELYEIFQDHPDSHLNDSEEPVIPADALVDVLRTFSRYHDAVELMTREEEEQLVQLIKSNPGLAVTPQVLLQFIALRTTVSPKRSPEGSPPPTTTEFEERGRSEERDFDDDDDDEGGLHSRSSSRDSTMTYQRGGSRPPSRGAMTAPKTPTDSPFDTSRRQRAAPLAANTAPSSWTRRPPPSRRKSDAGHSRTSSRSRASSDSESTTTRTPGRARAPSNPTSPKPGFVSPPVSKSISSPPVSTPSRPHSRTQSQPHFNIGSALDRFRGSPEREADRTDTGLMSPPPSDSSFDEEMQFRDQISSLQMPQHGDDSDSDGDDDSMLGRIQDRSAASSTVSMEVHERADALQRINTDLARKLVEAEQSLQNRLAEHELELEDMQNRLDEAWSELNATKREEKELRSKERQNSTQISTLESEIAKLQKSLDTARHSYQSLQKQYQEQCAESERYRNQLRQRDAEIKDYQNAASLHNIESQKLVREQATYEERIAVLEAELLVAQQAQTQLDEQKQENMMLKETIDRMRFDMDELRNSAGGLHEKGGSGRSSVHGSVSKSLGAELLSKMGQVGWGEEEQTEEPEPHPLSIEVDMTEEAEETESEDYVQTIITRTKRKVPSRATRLETVKVEEIKEYSDSWTQHEASEFTASTTMQTDPEPKPVTASFSIQTEERPVASTSTQTDPEPIPVVVVISTTSAGVQTEAEEEEEPLASSSSTLLPPTPKEAHHHDLPPDYHQVTNQDELALRVANETLKKWHQGLKLPIQPVPGGISDDAVEDWKALKEELGVQCTAIDRIVEESARTGQPRTPPRDGKAGRRKSGRFYNIYNTYVYGDPDGGSTPSGILLCAGAGILIAFFMGQAMSPQYIIPGGATYYDRAAWSSFNTMHAAGEGFPGDGAAVLGFLGRIGGGAARTLRGWPT